MSVIDDYGQFGGRHFASSAMQHVLAHAGVVDPRTGEPLTEAMCFGIGGGIGIGYAFCPSIPGSDSGSGVAIAGRYKSYATDGSVYAAFFDRLGVASQSFETAGVKKAHQQLVDAIEAGKPAIVWAAPMPVTRLSWSCALDMSQTVVFGVDEGRVLVADRVPTPLEVSLDKIERLRAAVCSFKNRIMTIEPPKKKLSKATLKTAVMDGIRACAWELLQPKMKTYGFPGLLDLSKQICNEKGKRGWFQVYDLRRMLLPMRDLFCSIELAVGGGGLFRRFYAEFLNEAADITGNKKLVSCANNYRELADEWTSLAEAILPDRVAAFKRIKNLLRKQVDLLMAKGSAASKQMDRINGDLHSCESDLCSKFPWSRAETMAHLSKIGKEIARLHDAERKAAEDLGDIARKS